MQTEGGCEDPADHRLVTTRDPELEDLTSASGLRGHLAGGHVGQTIAATGDHELRGRRGRGREGIPVLDDCNDLLPLNAPDVDAQKRVLSERVRGAVESVEATRSPCAAQRAAFSPNVNAHISLTCAAPSLAHGLC